MTTPKKPPERMSIHRAAQGLPPVDHDLNVIPRDKA